MPNELTALVERLRKFAGEGAFGRGVKESARLLEVELAKMCSVAQKPCHPYGGSYTDTCSNHCEVGEEDNRPTVLHGVFTEKGG